MKWPTKTQSQQNSIVVVKCDSSNAWNHGKILENSFQNNVRAIPLK